MLPCVSDLGPQNSLRISAYASRQLRTEANSYPSLYPSRSVKISKFRKNNKKQITELQYSIAVLHVLPICYKFIDAVRFQ